MIKVFINEVDNTSYVQDGSVGIVEQIQNKADVASFTLIPGATEPSENQEVLIYDTVKLVSATGVDIVVQDVLISGLSILDRGKFRVGEYFWLDVGGTDQERVEIEEIVVGATGQINITLVTAIVNTHSADEDCGKLIFGGTISSLDKTNPKQLADVEYGLTCTDFTKIYDKKLINDSWEDVSARYIINDALNTTINFNKEIDDMDYDDNAAVQAEWIEAGDGDNPLFEDTDVFQGTSAVKFPWTNAGGTATFAATPASTDVSELTGVAAGAPTDGNITLWYKLSAATATTEIKIRVGSGAGDYTEVSFTPIANTDDHFQSLKLVDGSTTGNPDWTVMDYAAIIFTETIDGNVIIDDLRMTADGSFTMFNFEDTSDFDDVRASFKKPTVFTQALADSLGFYWYIDYERDIHFFDRESNSAPFSLDDTSNNFENLAVSIDTSQLKNRQVVRGGIKTTESVYSQVVEGDDAVREWLTKSQFENLTIELDDGSSTDLMEAGTTTTNVEATAHGLVTGDYIVNRTRSNAVRQITKVDNDNFTVETVTAQANGDTFSKFDTAKTVGIENIDDESLFDYMSNFNEKSIRSADDETTLATGEFLLFEYNEIIPIRVQVADPASIATMKSLTGGDGIYDGPVITDNSLDSTQGARDRAQAEVNQWSNPVVNITFNTDYEGLHTGQLISISDTNKSINNDFVIQKVKTSFRDGFDFPRYQITAASTVFGIIEYFQKLSLGVDERLVDEDEVIDQIFGENVTITITDVNTFVPSEEASETATITITETDNSASDREMTTDPYKYQPHASDARYNLAQYK